MNDTENTIVLVLVIMGLVAELRGLTSVTPLYFLVAGIFQLGYFIKDKK